jgi:hypothetical protein
MHRRSDFFWFWQPLVLANAVSTARAAPVVSLLCVSVAAHFNHEQGSQNARPAHGAVAYRYHPQP